MRLSCIRLAATMLSAMLVLSWTVTSPCAEDNLVSAKVGILMKSGERLDRARGQDRLRSGDLIRVYVHPKRPTNVYVIHSSGNSLSLLNAVSQQVSSATVVLPSIQDFYEVDGKAQKEKITIICTPEPLPEADAITNGSLGVKQWEKIEKALIEKSRIDMGQSLQKPFPLAGNVRSVGNADPFIDKLPIYTGKDLLIKTYVFEIEK